MNGSNEKCAWISILICTPGLCASPAARVEMHNFPGESVVAHSFSLKQGGSILM